MLILGIVGGVNYVIDPFGMNRNYMQKGVNLYKDAYAKNTRKWKLFNAAKIQPVTLFLGNSRVEYLAPEQVFSRKEECFNFGFSGATSVEMKEVLEYSVEHFDLDTVYYMVDFVAVLDHVPEYRTGFDKDLYNDERRLFLEAMEVYLSYEALEATWNCYRQNTTDPEGRSVQYQYNAFGSRTNRWRQMQLNDKGDRWLNDEFKRIHNQYREIYFSDSTQLSRHKMDAVLDIINICDKHNIELRLVVLPVYTNQYVSLMCSPLFDDYLQFLESMVQLHPVHYFGGMNKFTKDRSLYWDTQHPRNRLASILFPMIWGNQSPPDEFYGIELKEGGIASFKNKLMNLRNELLEIEISAENKGLTGQ